MTSLDDGNRILCLLISALIFLNAYFSKLVTKSWSSPGALYSLIWFFCTFFPLIFIFDAPVNPLSVLFILICCMLFSVSASFRRWDNIWQTNKIAAIDNQHIVSSYENAFFIGALVFSVFVALVCLIVDQTTSGISLSDFKSDFVSTVNQNIRNRYDQRVVISLYGQIGNVMTLLAAILGGLIYNFRRSWILRTGLMLFSLLPMLFELNIRGVRGEFAVSCSLFFAGTMINGIRLGYTGLFRSRNVIQLLGLFALSTPMIYFNFLLRGPYLGEKIGDSFKPIISQIANYAFGHLFAFSDWFSNRIGQYSYFAYERENLTFGFYTFMAPFRWAGNKQYIPLGTYGEKFVLGETISTNIFTIFRGLITDYGMIGALAFFLISGIVANEIYYRVVTRDRSSFFSALYILMFGAAGTSFVISFWDYNTPFILLFMVSAISYIQNHFFIDRPSRPSRPKTPKPVVFK